MRKKVFFLVMVLLLVSSLSMLFINEKVLAEKATVTKSQSGWGSVNRIDLGQFDSGVLSLKKNETCQITGVVYFSGDDRVIKQAKVYFKTVAPELQIDYNDNLVIRGKQGYFSFSVTLLSDIDRAYSFKIMVADRRESQKQLAPTSSTQTVFLKTGPNESTNSTTTDDPSKTTGTTTTDSSVNPRDSSGSVPGTDSSEDWATKETTDQSSTSMDSSASNTSAKSNDSSNKTSLNSNETNTAVTTGDINSNLGNSASVSNFSSQEDSAKSNGPFTGLQDSQAVADLTENRSNGSNHTAKQQRLLQAGSMYQKGWLIFGLILLVVDGVLVLKSINF